MTTHAKGHVEHWPSCWLSMDLLEEKHPAGEVTSKLLKEK
jgi:hypothetical protein